MNCRHDDGPASEARRSFSGIPRWEARASQASHFPGICGAGATRAVTTGLPSTLPAKQATLNWRNGDGPASDARRSVTMIRRFIASASHVLYVGVQASDFVADFVAAVAGAATQAMSAPVIANVVMRMLLLLFFA